MASKRELEALIVLAGKIDPSLQKAIRSAEKSTNNLSKATSFLEKTSSKAFSIMAKGVAIGAAAIGAGMVAVAKTGLDLASDLTEVQNVVDVTFGKGAQQINAWSQTALKSYGLSELSAKKYSSTLGALMKSSGVSSDNLVSMSENLSALSGDFASFYNLSTDDAFEKIRAGISGETEPLKQLGINMDVANLQAFALSKGIKTSYDKMDQASKTILRYNYLLEMSKDAQGDFNRTQDSYANQQRLFQESFKQLAATIMKTALPALTSLFQKGNQMISAFTNDPQKIANLQATIGKVVDKVVAAIPTAISIAKDFASVLGTVLSVAWDVFNVIRNNWSVIEPIIIGIVGAMVLWKAAMMIKNVISAVTETLSGLKWVFEALRISKLKDASITLYLQSLYAKDAILRGAQTVATWGMVAASAAWNVAATIGAGITWALGAAFAFLTSPIGLIIIAIAALVAGIIWLWNNWEMVSNWIVGLWQNNVLPFFQGIGDFFGGIFDGVVKGFKGFLNFFVDGLNFFIRQINAIQFDVPDWVPLIGGMHFGFDIPEVPRFAKGGFANQPSIFGEAGPEAAIPLKRTPRSLSLLNQTARMLGVSGGDGGSPQFIFAPVIGGAGGGSMMSDLKSAADDFFDRCDRWWESKRRDSFD